MLDLSNNTFLLLYMLVKPNRMRKLFLEAGRLLVGLVTEVTKKYTFAPAKRNLSVRSIVLSMNETELPKL